MFQSFWQVFRNRKMAALLFFGFSAGLPLYLTSKTLQAWMTVEKVDLKTIIDFFQIIVTTPNILTKVSNLTDKLAEPDRSSCFTILGQFITQVQETYIESKIVANKNEFIKLGLTNCGVKNIARNKYLVLTVDFPLFGYLSKKGIEIINFNYLRDI